MKSFKLVRSYILLSLLCLLTLILCSYHDINKYYRTCVMHISSLIVFLKYTTPCSNQYNSVINYDINTILVLSDSLGFVEYVTALYKTNPFNNKCYRPYFTHIPSKLVFLVEPLPCSNQYTSATNQDMNTISVLTHCLHVVEYNK